jgi:cytochrome c oxidase subunit 2
MTPISQSVPILQSVLSPHGAQAGQIATLAWVLFAVAAVVLLLVVIAAGLALRGAPGVRRVLAGERTVVAFGLVTPVVVLTALLGYGVFLMRAQLAPVAADAVRIELTGLQWWWRVDYAEAGAPPIASANEVRIPVGRPVLFTLKAADVIHSFWVPSLGGKVDMIPGRATQLRLTAERPGIYRGQCAEYCGGPHALMALDVIALDPSEYEAWRAREARPARAPEDEQERNGQHLFLAAGCGTCHAIRGTAATGSIGPDLTHFGGRRSVGIDTLPLTAAHVTRFIHDGQHIKPGNRMPEFRIFSADEHAALAAYLLSLR